MAKHIDHYSVCSDYVYDASYVHQIWYSVIFCGEINHLYALPSQFQCQRIR